MEFYKDLLITLQLSLFPILLYFYYNAYSIIPNKRREEIVYYLTLVVTTLSLVFSNIINIQKETIFLTLIPLLFLYNSNKRKMGLLYSVAVVIYCSIFYNKLYIILIPLFIFIYFLFLIKYIKNRNPIITNSIIFIFIYSLGYFFNILNIINFNLNILFLIAFIIYLVSIFLIIFFNKRLELITYHAQALENMKRANVNISIGKIIHEVKNPLVVVKGYVDIMKRETPSKEIKIIDKEVKRTLTILDDFGSLNKLKVYKKNQRLDLLIKRIIVELDELIKESNINLICDINENTYAFIDEQRIKQVIINILKNSIEALSTHENKTIEITLQKLKKHIKLTIKDNGDGVKNSEIKKLGSPLYTTKKNGTGLGIALSKEIMELHGGNLHFESKYHHYMKAILLIKK